LSAFSICFHGQRTYEQDLTGKNRERGTLIPMALSKCYLSADTEGMMGKTYLDSGTNSGLELDNGLSLVGDLISAPNNTIHKPRLTLLLTMISRFKASSSMTFLIAFKLHPINQFSSRKSIGQLTDVVGVEDLIISFSPLR